MKEGLFGCDSPFVQLDIRKKNRCFPSACYLIAWMIKSVYNSNYYSNWNIKNEMMEVNGMLTDIMKNELIQGLKGLFSDNILMIILYGSVARNEATPESDIDIAIIMKKEMDEETKNRFMIWTADMDIRYDRVFSIIDILEENMKKWGNVLPFYRNVKKEGLVLWKAA